MSQGLTSAANRVHSSRLIHPKTGEPIIPIGFINGRAVWPIMGASEDDPDDGANDPPDGDNGDPDGTGDGDGGGGSDDSDDLARKAQDKKLAEENARRRKNERKLEAELEEARAKLKEIEDADKSELEKTSETVTELTTKNEKLEARVGELALQNAFLSDNTFKWANPRAALRLVDLSEVTIDQESGEVEGLKEALKKLAKDEPYLLAKDSDEDEEPSPPAGQPPRQKKGSAAANRQALEKKFPALRRG